MFFYSLYYNYTKFNRLRTTLHVRKILLVHPKMRFMVKMCVENLKYLLAENTLHQKVKNPNENVHLLTTCFHSLVGLLHYQCYYQQDTVVSGVF